MRPRRPVFRYHGGKWGLAPWIISHFPTHRVYVEPYGGGGSVLMRKPAVYAEIYNDLDSEVVNVFRVLRSPDQAERLRHLLELTPFSYDEFQESYKESEDPVEGARRTVFRAMAGFGSAAVCKKHKTGFRACSNRSGTTPAHDWANYPALLPAFTNRLLGVVIENRAAVKVIAQHDGPNTLHYVDPPYVWGTRRPGAGAWQDSYRHEMTDEQHLELLAFLGTVQGMVILSGYRCELYDDALKGWGRVDRASHADGARDRVESLWLNPAVMERRSPTLFEDAEAA